MISLKNVSSYMIALSLVHIGMGLSRYLHVATVEVFSKLRCPPREQAELLRSEKCVVVAIRYFCLSHKLCFSSIGNIRGFGGQLTQPLKFLNQSIFLSHNNQKISSKIQLLLTHKGFKLAFACWAGAHGNCGIFGRHFTKIPWFLLFTLHHRTLTSWPNNFKQS